MTRPAIPHGYTLVEVIVAILVFGVGVLALAASSAIAAKAMTANALREGSGRIAGSRIEIIHSQCRAAGSGTDRARPVSSRWVVSRTSSSHISVEESVTYTASNGLHTDTYRAAVWCP